MICGKFPKLISERSKKFFNGRISQSENDKISSTKLDCYFSFMQGAKSANTKVFKGFCNVAQMEKNSQTDVYYFIVVP
jgi:hypothetical protein